jgi:hypothetical protein
MEFDTLVDFFASLMEFRRKYPMILTYRNYLKTIKDVEQSNEVELFKNFLVDNQSLSDKTLDMYDFKTGKKCVTINMRNFITGKEDDPFWDKILNVERILFPDGKPTKKNNPTQDVSGLTGAMAEFESNPIMGEVIKQVRNMGNMDDISDINSLMAKPEFKNMVNNIKKNLQTGKYNLKDLTGTVTKVIKSVQHDLDDETKNTLKVVTDTMEAVERDEPVDISNLMSMVNELKLDNLSGAK